MNNEFLMRIKSYIPDEYNAFIDTLDHPMYKGLRVNTKKMDMETFLNTFPYVDEKCVFCKDTYYVYEQLGNHPYHACGVYYLQEPSASSAVEILDVQESDIVLDMCAAPGGKSTQIASKIQSGFIVSNEIDSKRAQILLSNMERMGVMNMAVTNSTPQKIGSTFPCCFDKVLVDAPCSGEGMMKKHDIAKDNWSMDNIELCARRQKEILEEAYKVLKKDGILVYSTCTYAKEENEEVIAHFLREHEDMEQVDVSVSFGRRGLETEGMDASKVCRIFPMDHGEGHFVAKLVKRGGSQNSLPFLKMKKCDKLITKFLKEQLDTDVEYIYGTDKIYCMDFPFVDFKKVKLLRQGIYCGDILKNRFEPAHAFYLCAKWIPYYKKKCDTSFDEMNKFMHGLELSHEQERGYTCMMYKGIPYGFGKSDGMHIKNKIPKGLRMKENVNLMKEEEHEY